MTCYCLKRKLKGGWKLSALACRLIRIASLSALVSFREEQESAEGTVEAKNITNHAIYRLFGSRVHLITSHLSFRSYPVTFVIIGRLPVLASMLT